jgi:hypothetical protein
MKKLVNINIEAVVEDNDPELLHKLKDLRGRELPGIPGSWISEITLQEPPKTSPEPTKVTYRQTEEEYDNAAEPWEEDENWDLEETTNPED